MSLLDSGISRTVGVSEEFMRPSESASAVASANFGWVIAFFLFNLTPPTSNSGPDKKVPKAPLKKRPGSVEPGLVGVGARGGEGAPRPPTIFSKLR
jgi:hypothetical protein